MERDVQQRLCVAAERMGTGLLRTGAALERIAAALEKPAAQSSPVRVGWGPRRIGWPERGPIGSTLVDPAEVVAIEDMSADAHYRSRSKIHLRSGETVVVFGAPDEVMACLATPACEPVTTASISVSGSEPIPNAHSSEDRRYSSDHPSDCLLARNPDDLTVAALRLARGETGDVFPCHCREVSVDPAGTRQPGVAPSGPANRGTQENR